ncbi:hypothetical protein MFLAVUS_001278 [Mucor flavus]|uniref:Uncharacterized protein n=1 Tax=Mucor flavus TaxID=439312 RepID=A0ABP9YM15_9FUNG
MKLGVYTKMCLGLTERKIFRKSVPNNGLLIKVFNKRTCTSDDLSHVHIHSVATLMQDALWSTQDPCTLSSLSTVITSKAERLLRDILDFLVELMQYKSLNLMDAYKLGDALGKVVLGPADCGPIITEKAGHFLTRMIIEHAKINYQQKNKRQQVIRRIDSGFDSSPSYSCHSFYTEYNPLCKTQGTQARAKFYNRVVSRTRGSAFDWIENTVGVQSLLDDDYAFAPEPPEKPWISIFTSTDLLMKPHKDMIASPLLFRILREASKPIQVTSSDPFAASYLFNASKIFWAERQIREAFTEFLPNQLYMGNNQQQGNDRSNPLKKLNHSISHLKLNIRKYRSKHDLLEESFISEDTIVEDQIHYAAQEPKNNYTTTNNMRNVMKKMIKMGGITQQQKDRRNKVLA